MTWHRRFFGLLILLLPTQLGIHFWPEWAMVLGRRVDYLSPTLYFTDILVVITIIAWFLSSRDPASRRGVAISHFMRLLSLRFALGRNDRKPKAMILIIATLLFAAINIFVATNPMVAVYKWIKVGEFVALGWYIVRTKPATSFIIYHLSFGILFSSLLAISQFLLQRSVGGPLWWLGERTFDVTTPGIARTVWQGREILRPYATFPHPNVLGGFLAVVLPLVTLRYLGSLGNLSRKTKIYYGFVLLTGVVALLLTFSRSAIVVGTIALASVVFRRKTHLFFTTILLLLAFFYLLPFTFSEESFVVRWQLNAAAVNVWRGAPLFGVGLGNFLVRLPEVLPARTIYFLQPAHNIYLLLLSEIGVVGAVWVVWATIRSKTSKKSQKQDKLVLLVPLLTLLLLGVVDHYPLTLQQGQLLLTILFAMSFR